jgi:dephospho-CoA kinase
LGRLVFGQPEQLHKLEAILHPMVQQDRDRFLARHRRSGQNLVILDVPLLFEKDGWKICDRSMVVTAPAFLQAARVLRRPGMDMVRLTAIRHAQMGERKKTRLADFVIPTGLGKGQALRRLVRSVTLTKLSIGKARCAKLSWIRKRPD